MPLRCRPGPDANTNPSHDTDTYTHASHYTDSYSHASYDTDSNSDGYPHPDACCHAYTDVRTEQSSVLRHAERGPRGAADREHSHRLGQGGLRPGADGHDHGRPELCGINGERDHGPHPWSGRSGMNAPIIDNADRFSGGDVRDLFE